MRYVWDSDDIEPGVEANKHFPGFGDTPHFERYMIGAYSGNPNVMGLFYLDKGLFIDVGNGTKEAVAAYMTEQNFRPMTG